MENTASSVCKHNQSTGMWYLFHWKLCITNQFWLKCSVALLAVLSIWPQKLLPYICYVSRFFLPWTKSCLYNSNNITDKRWLHWLCLRCVVTCLMKTVYGNHIVILRPKEPTVKIFQIKPECNIVHILFAPLATLGWGLHYSQAFLL